MCTQRGFSLTDVLFHHANRGASHPAEILALGHHGDSQIVIEHEAVVGGIWEVERNLHGLTMGVPPLRM
jgi:hypothetical protein